MNYHVENNKAGGCGTCALKTILKMYGLPIKNIPYSKKGISPKKIMSFLYANKISAVIKYNISFENIKSKSILYYKIDHYIVTGGIKGDKIKIYDSDRTKAIWLSRKTFEKKWEPWAIETNRKRIC